MRLTTTAHLVCGAALALSLSACGPVRQAPQEPVSAASEKPSSAKEPPSEEATPTGTAVPATGIVAKASTSAYPVEARNVRLVRTGEDQLALQFELYNGLQEELAPGLLGIDLREQHLALVDPPRGTAYGLLQAADYDGRISTNTEESIPAGESATITAMFPAPPKETREMLVGIGGMLPVVAPVLPTGDASLRDDAVLSGPRGEPRTGPLICKVGGGGGAQAPVEFRLPSDVLFAFGKASLSPAAKAAIAEVGQRITADSGKIVIEGHTDAVGTDAANDTLSRQRATAVADALRATVGAGFTYEVKGYGEAKPVAPNTQPDGSDNPDGRAQNRRVEVLVETAGVKAELAERAGDTTTLSDSGFKLTVQEVRRYAGYVLAKATVANPTDKALDLDYVNAISPREITLGQLSFVDGTAGRRHELCAFAEPTYFDFIGNFGQTFWPDRLGTVPPGAEVVMWGLFAAPGADTTSVEVEMGGYTEALPADITN